ncbi:helix-turn-helix transcriptional regulator [Streptacidiphilus carbonis]|jgi:AraC-like DNA-binding protein|uniref:helix-turn-helix transcriptional regulator n=1 Tax=Streptacidiphilus carbonis TaxID=105422 RepID=UPI0005A93FE0|nr:AraC family transcriptional regulator [Streptacidiphilus carbonis]
MVAAEEVTAWHPEVPGISEVFHAHFVEHAYPMHAHANWTLLIVDDGAVRYDLDRHERGVLSDLVSLLPPQVPHNGRAATALGFRKRVLYLEPECLGTDLIGAAVDTPAVDDPLLRRRVHQLHHALQLPGDELEAESRLALICGRLRGHLLRRTGSAPQPPRDRTVAHRLRDLIDARVVEGLTLEQAAEQLHANPAHLVRAFTSEFDMPPHQYLTSRRVDRARGLLLDGVPARTVAVDAGFYDQSHLTRHFRRIVGTSPGRFARRPR